MNRLLKNLTTSAIILSFIALRLGASELCSQSIEKIGLRIQRPDDSIIANTFADFLEKALGFQKFNRLWQQSMASGISSEHVFDRIIRGAKIAYKIDHKLGSNVPTSGPLLVVMNHPRAGLETFPIAKEILKVRSDIKIVAHHGLGFLKELNPFLISAAPVESGYDSMRTNRAAFTSMKNWLKEGHVLILFPAGWVSKEEGHDQDWKRSLGLLIRIAKPVVLPVFVSGKPSLRIRLAAKINREIAQLFLPQEILTQTESDINYVVGSNVSAQQLLDRGLNDKELSLFLQKMTEALPQGVKHD